MTVAADDLLRTPDRRSLTDDDWSRLATHLTRTLADALATELTTDSWAVVDGEALTCRVSGSVRALGTLDIAISAIIGVETIAGAARTDAVVFAFTGDRRIGITSATPSYAVLTYDPAAGWSAPVWVIDEYGEYDGRRAPRQPGAKDTDAR